MSKYDAQRALTIYKTFAKQTSLVVEFLGTARQYENATRLEIPKLKHAPTSLTSSLEEYLNDPDFEVNRRQYLAHQDLRKGRKPAANGNAESADKFKKQAVNSGSTSAPFPEPKAMQNAAPPPPAPKSPAPDLIDFFDSIEQNQQQMVTQSQQQAPMFQNTQHTGFAPQQNFQSQPGPQPQGQQSNGSAFDHGNSFGQPQQQQPFPQNITGAGFGGYNPQSYPQQQDAFSNASQTTGSSFPSQQQVFNTGQTSFAPSQQPFNTGQSQSTNPFRQSMFPQATSGSAPLFPTPPEMPQYQNQQSTNPFARQTTGQSLTTQFPQIPNQQSPFTSPPPQQPQSTPFMSPPPQPQQMPVQHMTPQRTGTNPFARNTATPTQGQPSAQPLVASPTGTNPFRQSMFVNQQTGQGWQAGQGTIGGLEQLGTMPVFPRPGQPQLQQQPNPWT